MKSLVVTCLIGVILFTVTLAAKNPCDKDWEIVPDYKKDADPPVCVLLNGIKESKWMTWYEAHDFCSSQYARIVQPVDRYDVEALRKFLLNKNKIDEKQNFWAGYKRRDFASVYSEEVWRKLVYNRTYYKDIYDMSVTMPDSAWRFGQPNDVQYEGIEHCVARKKLRQGPKKENDDAEDPDARTFYGLDDYPCDIKGHIVMCERDAPDEYEKNEPFEE